MSLDIRITVGVSGIHIPQFRAPQQTDSLHSSLCNSNTAAVGSNVSLCASVPRTAVFSVPNVEYRLWKYSKTSLVMINWSSQPSGYAENPDNYIFL